MASCFFVGIAFIIGGMAVSSSLFGLVVLISLLPIVFGMLAFIIGQFFQ